MQKALSVICIVVFIFGSSVSAQRLSDLVMKPEEAASFAHHEIHPILDEYIANLKELPELVFLIRELKEHVNKKKVIYVVQEKYFYPNTNQLFNLFHIPPFPTLVISAPRARDIKFKESKRDFEDTIALLWAHQMIRIEEFGFTRHPNASFTPEGEAVIEARATARVIMLARKMAQQNRKPVPELLKLSDILAGLGDDPEHQDWIGGFLGSKK